MNAAPPPVDYQTSPEQYKHWKMTFEGPVATLAHNSHGKFEDRWIHLEATPGKCPFLKGYQRFYLPIAHGEP